MFAKTASLRFGWGHKALAALVGALALFAAAAKTEAADNMKFYGGAAREITSSLRAGDGWTIVSDRQKVTLVDGADPIDCVKFRAVLWYSPELIQHGDGTETDAVLLLLGKETPWIAVDTGVPVNSGPAVKAEERAGAAVQLIDDTLPELEKAIENETDSTVLTTGVKLIAALKEQRGALVELSEKAKESAAVNRE